MDKLISLINPKSHVSEAYRAIRTNIEFSNPDGDLKVICVTSSIKNEGKSTVISNLAVNFQKLDKNILLIDGDLRNPSLYKLFNIRNENGLTDVLFKKSSFEKCVKIEDGLHILTGGIVPPNPSEVLSSKTMREFISEIRDMYDYIFIDSPPIGIVTDAGIISSYSDGVIFVIGSNQVDSNIAKNAKERLDKLNANILGVIVNKFNMSRSEYGYYEYYYTDDNGVKKIKKRKKEKKRRR